MYYLYNLGYDIFGYICFFFVLSMCGKLEMLLLLFDIDIEYFFVYFFLLNGIIIWFVKSFYIIKFYFCFLI